MIKRKDGFRGERSVVLPPMLVEIEERDELCQGLFITDIGYYPRAEQHHCAREQGVNQYVLIYCVDGSGFYIVDGKRHEVSKNQYFILPIGKPHEYGAAEGQSWTIYWVHFRGKAAHVFAEGAATPQTISVTMNSRIGDRINIFEEMMATLHCGERRRGDNGIWETGVEDLRYASSLLMHFLASMRYLGQFRRAGAAVADTDGKRDAALCNSTLAHQANTDIVEQAIHYMRENIGNRITLEEVLHYVGYSQSHFTAVFKKKTGQSPLGYFNRLKVEHACQLLRSTDMRINMICYKVGIEDPLYFSRLFSKVMGMSPTEYKRRSLIP